MMIAEVEVKELCQSWLVGNAERLFVFSYHAELGSNLSA